ncbi:MAG: hypothetical protein KDD47_11815, partial [Acidobacteria bacterium]|nr:hypothetical protein [Acidobacteriota bacterium]
VVNDCSLLFPGNPGYFGDGGTGIASNLNAIWGDYFLVDPAADLAHGDSLVHVEAYSSVQEGFWEPGDYTFYGRYHSFDARDNREPLTGTWLARYFTAEPPRGGFTTPTTFLCWRDSGLNDSFFFTCGTFPNPYPLSQNGGAFFDEQENPTLGMSFPFSPIPVALDLLYCPGATFRLSSSVFRPSEALPVFYETGWFFLNLNTSSGSVSDPIKQSYLTTVHQASGTFSVGFPAIGLGSALDKTFTVTTAPLDVNLPREAP